MTRDAADAAGLPCSTWWAVLAAMILVLSAPLLVSDLPVMGDYSNHLARMFVLTHIQADAVLARMYEVNWNIVPNLAMDLVVPPLSHAIPLTAAGRLFIALSISLPILGIAALRRAVFGVRDVWVLAGGLVAYNGFLFWGFLNFVAGMGLALLGVALWVHERDRPPARRLAPLIPFALVLFFCHLEALALFGLTIGCIEVIPLWDDWRAGTLTLRAVASRLAMCAAPFIIPAALFLLAAPLGQGVAHKPVPLQIKEYYWAVRSAWGAGKLLALGYPFESHSPLADAVAAAALALAAIAQMTGTGCRTSRGLLLAALLLMLAYPLLPSVWLTAANIDARFPTFAAMLVLAGLAPDGTIRPLARLLLIVFCLATASRAGLTAYAWRQGDDDIARARTLFQAVQPGERVLVISGQSGAPAGLSPGRLLYQPAEGSLAPLLTMERDAFWPTLFTSRTLQPLHVRPPYLAISVEQAEQPKLLALTAPGERDLWLTPYIKDWARTFDYVLVEGFRDTPETRTLIPGSLERLDGNSYATLFRIRK